MLALREVLTLTELKAEIEAGGVVVVNYTAPGWCRPCQQFAPHFEALETIGHVPNLTTVKVDVDRASRQVSEWAGVLSVPTVALYVDGLYVDRLAGRTALSVSQEVEGHLSQLRAAGQDGFDDDGGYQGFSSDD